MQRHRAVNSRVRSPYVKGKELTLATLYLIAQLGATYPDDAPYLTIDTTLPEKDEEGPAPEDLTSEDKDVLLQSLSDTAQESLGMAMIFTLASALKEQAEALLAARQERREQEARRAQQEVERQEQKKFEGTKVTPESFAAWQAKFKLEMRRKELEAEELALKRAGPNAPAKKLTGRQLFEGDKTLATSDAALLGDDVEFDFSKFDRTVRLYPEDDEEDERRF